MNYYIPGFMKPVIEYNNLLESRIAVAVKGLGLDDNQATAFRGEVIEFAKTHPVAVLTAVDQVFRDWKRKELSNAKLER